MRFKRAVQRYGRTPEAITPYQRAAQVWDDRIGSARVQARNWRVMALGSLLLSSSLAAALVWEAEQSRVVPYVVEVDHLGEARAVAPAARDYQPTDPEIAWQLSRFISNVRAVSLDPVLMRANWLAAYDFVTERGAKYLSAYARQAQPFAKIGMRAVSVQVTSVVRASPNSFEIKWVETSYERGNLVGSTHWTAILSFVVKPPHSADILVKNPLGLYVDAIDWSKEIEPTPAGSAAPPAPPPAQGANVPANASPFDRGAEPPNPTSERIAQ